ncbi:MAG: hypothetical protein HQL67_00455 [Magnetococcales bacterium]|nr:hypothetical protein [Magnetococcales bacterium]
MSIFFLIDGLLMDGDPPLESSMPELARLVAVGQGGTVSFGNDSSTPESGQVYRQLLLGPERSKSLPLLGLGYLSALGLGLNPDPGRTWACLELMHLFQKTNKLLFFPPERVGLSPTEKSGLLRCLEAEFQAQGWSLHWSEDYGEAVLSSSTPCQAEVASCTLLDGGSFYDFLPRGIDANRLLALVTTGQMLLSQEPINRQRIQQQKLPLNTPWVWGLAPGDPNLDIPALLPDDPKQVWSSNPSFSGLARLAGFWPNCFDEVALTNQLERVRLLDVAKSGCGVIHFNRPAHLARLGLMSERQDLLRQIDQQVLAYVAAQLAEGGGPLVVSCSATLDRVGKPLVGPVPWLRVAGKGLGAKKRFWHRRTLFDGQLFSVSQFRREWMR